MTDFERACLDRVLPAAAGPADWGDVMRRAAAGRGRRRALVVLVAVAAVAVITASALAVRAFFIDEGYIGIPPVGAAPSTPPTGQLVLSAYGLGDVFDRQGYLVNRIRGRLWVYADGRLITVHDGRLPGGANSQSTGLIERRLSPKGLALLRSAVLSTGLFEHSRTVHFDYGPCFNFIRVRNRGTPVRVTWFSTQCPRGRAATPREARDLRSLASRLMRPESWLPADAWIMRDVRAYVPARFELSYGPWKPNVTAAQALGVLPLRARAPLRDERVRREQGMVGSPSNPTPARYFLFRLTTGKARALRAALVRAGLRVDRRGADQVLGYRLGRHVAAQPITLTFVPILPHGEAQGLGG